MMVYIPSYLELQCRWLHHSRSKPESDRHFNAYYKALEKKLLPYIMSKLSDGRKYLAPDIFQDLMTYHFRICEERGPAAKVVQERAPLLNPLGDDQVFVARVQKWGGLLSDWTSIAIGFCACQWPGSKPPECERRATIINDSLEPLRIDGETLVKQHQGDGKAADLSGITEAINGDEMIPSDEHPADDNSSNEFAAEVQLLIRLSSKVRIPLILLLRWKAKKMIIDNFRASKPNREVTLDAQEGNSQEVKEALNVNTDEQVREEWMGSEEIDMLLRAPLEKAEDVLHSVRTSKERTRAEQRLDKEKVRYEFNSEVVRFTQEGYTEVEIAAKLHTTRDKVRTRKKDIYGLLADGCKTAWENYRRRKRLSELFSGLVAATEQIDGPLPPSPADSPEHCTLLAEVDALLAVPVQKAERQLRALKHKKMLIGDRWVEDCVAKRKIRLVEPEREKKQREEYLQWIEDDGVAPESLSFSLGIKPDLILKYRRNIQKNEREIQITVDELNERRTYHDRNAPKVRSMLQWLLAADVSNDAVSQSLSLSLDEVYKLDEQIFNLLHPDQTGEKP
jgi:hypothetical protein